MKKYLFGVSLALLITGCTSSPKPAYNYENYSEEYYKYQKNANAEESEKLQKGIENILNNTQKSETGKVPPGMYANLGCLHLKDKKYNEAINDFANEKIAYPESSQLMERMINKVQSTKEGKK